MCAAALGIAWAHRAFLRQEREVKLLYVENHAIFVQIAVERFLAAHDVTVTGSVSGALALLASETFDAVLVDYDLDDGKGSDVIRSLRERGSRIPVIAVSAKSDGNAELIKAGADAVCGKMEFAKIESILATVCPG